MTKIDEIANKHYQELKHKGALSVRPSTKFVDGKDTGEPSLAVFVLKKKPMTKLKPDEVIPSNIEGIRTDVVELAPKTWKIGETGISMLSPEEQRRRASGVR